MMVRFALENGVGAVELFGRADADELVREGQLLSDHVAWALARSEGSNP